jgi:hypothetical protein
MENHVSGHVTASAETLNPLAALRQSILAVVVGNPHFTEEEQLLANHLTYECEAETRLATWLRNVRRLDAQRGRQARLHCSQHQQAVCYSEETQYAELAALLKCQALHPRQKGAALHLVGDAIYTPSMRLRFLGDAYFALLHNVGYQEALDKRSGLYSN